MARVAQINVSGGGVPKSEVPRGYVGERGIVGDSQADRVHHGSPDQALCLFSMEVIRRLQDEGHPIFPGATGENITLEGLDWSALAPGQRFRIGDVVEIELTDYATPCAKNASWFLNGEVLRMSQRLNPGWSRIYARVLKPGEFLKGDTVTRLDP